LSDQITVRVFKYDGTEYRRWPARLSRQTGPLLVFDARFDTDVDHDLLGQIRCGTRTIEYYWLDRWYNVFQFLNEDGSTRLYYCNINLPPVFEGPTLSYVDLDIDLLVQPDLSLEVLDLDEFEANAAHYHYPVEVIKGSYEALENLKQMIATSEFPFQTKSAIAPVIN